MSSRRLFTILICFFCIYIIWGSTYLAIKYALPSFPPFFLAGLRFVMGGLILTVLGRARREPGVSWRDFKIGAFSGILMAFGNALVCLTEESFASGLVAVIVGTLPAWIMLLNWQFFGGLRPVVHQFLGLALSLFGVVLLTRNEAGHSDLTSLVAWSAISVAVLSWTLGTLIQRRAHSRDALFTFVGGQLGCGGLALLAIWLCVNGPSSFHPERVTPQSVWAIVYLAVFGSVIAFTAYLWLNREVEPALVSTYALANPVVAVWLGWLFLGESLTKMTLVSSLFVILGLTLILVRDRAVFTRAFKKTFQ